MIVRTYLFSYYLTIFITVVVLGVATILVHPDSVKYLADKFLKENEIAYSRVEGSLLTGVTLHDINYADTFTAKRVEVGYNFFMLFNPTPVIRKIKADKVVLNLDKLPKNQEGSDEFFAFAIGKLQLRDASVIFEDERFVFNLKASRIDYGKTLDVRKLFIELFTPYADATIDGKIDSSRLYAKTLVTPKASVTKKYLGFLEGVAKTIAIDVDASLQKIFMRTHFNRLGFSADQNIRVGNADVNLTYFTKEEYVSLDSSYTLSYQEFEAEVKQNGIFSYFGAYFSELSAELTKYPQQLPFKRFSAEFAGDTESLAGKIKTEQFNLNINSKDYKEFMLHVDSKALALSSISQLPDMLKKHTLTVNADAVIAISPFSLIGTFNTQGLYCSAEGNIALDGSSQLFFAQLYPKLELEIFKSYPADMFSPLEFIYYNEDEKAVLNLDANMFGLTLFKSGTSLNGLGNFGSQSFDVKGGISDKNDANITLSANIPSLNTLLSEFGLVKPEDGIFFDAEAKIEASVDFSENMQIKSRLHIPWSIARVDTKTAYTVENIYFEATTTNRDITIEQYTLDFKNHNFNSQKKSKISFDNNATLKLKEFWIYDNLLVTGLFNPVQMKGDLQIKSDMFKYEGKEASVTLKADVDISLDGNGTQKIEGDITLLDGVITYEPPVEYTISDDIIIIQDIKPQAQSKRFINIHVNSLKPIAYKTKNIDLRFVPDMVLWQEPSRPLALLGMVTIEEGRVTASDKLFTFEKSEVYFNGASPINPHLSLNMHYQTLNYIDIEIYITNTLASPIVIFKSTPYLSQNDIMSYILFGEPAASAFDSSSGAKTSVSSLLLATGVKQIFNDTAGVNIDTLNVLTNEEGTLGYEIGARFSDKLRVIYKNDTISSIILQYSFSKSIRLDINLHETGQGINILYVKDF
ncbi:translocation/assembly module TamB domain-containing protein [Candidatus Sulfurimonas marisnigri]|uniref:Translocation/assembly module TamB domain-containing protein n=1 Tax=Candidatus Sulfurimonas marisnigri TaxID=2740405 RepID=A0A7S7RQV9_9BACT|nr:translocation/assembly module TamB domain-containing protein [Candidatus Sulfurimonas marisnigri]QOY54840.1 translocation/assembly module TamB domain-containing protein [Candidatus Sulfurimonas marisnigri]